MSTPFPGMDPYLERRDLWKEVHADLIVGIRKFLAPLVQPRYRVAIEQDTYLTLNSSDEQRAGIPDVLVLSSKGDKPQPTSAIAAALRVKPLVGELPMAKESKQRYLTVRDLKSREVVTAIEILSPGKKTSRAGREQYQRKRFKILSSLTNLVEIDLLRVGKPLPMTVTGQSAYRIIISRNQKRPKADIYLFSIQEPIPDFPIPLRPGEKEPILPLNQLLHTLYNEGFYHLAIDYQQPPEPQLLDEDAEWAKQLLAKR